MLLVATRHRTADHPFALLLRALVWAPMRRVWTAPSETPFGYLALLGGAWLAEVDRNIGPTVGTDGPRGGDVVVRTEDVRLVLRAVHEHGVELRVVDPARPPADVLTDLTAEMTGEVAADPVVMLERDTRSGKLGRLGSGHCRQTRAPGQRSQVVACSGAGACWVAGGFEVTALTGSGVGLGEGKRPWGRA